MPVDKSGRFYVVGSVSLLQPEAQTVAEMLEGWGNQQLCRNLAHDTIEQRIALVQRFLDYTNEFLWTWTAAMVEEFFSDLRAISRRKQSTVRGYQNTLRLFCAYVADPDYGWDRVCVQRFGTRPAQVFFEWNTAARPRQRAIPYQTGVHQTGVARTSSTKPTIECRRPRTLGARAGCRPTATR